MAQHVTMLLVLRSALRVALTIGRVGVWGGRLQVLGGMEEVDELLADSSLRRQLPEKAPVVARRVGQLDHPQIGPLLQGRLYLGAQHPFEPRFPASGIRPNRNVLKRSPAAS